MLSIKKSMQGLILLLFMLPSLGLQSCAQGPSNTNIARSDVKRQSSPEVLEGDLEQLAEGNTEFALDLYAALRAVEKGNFFSSPYSISLALAMTYAGARGQTEAEMAQTMHYTLSQGRLHSAFNALDLELARRGEAEQSSEDEAKQFQLRIANSIWGQADYPFLQDYLDILAANYDAGLRLVDFEKAPEQAGEAINAWVEEQTENRIKDLIPPGMLSPLTRLVLANAIYFNASWMNPFSEADTHEDDFKLLDGSQVQVPMMTQSGRLRYASGEGWQAVELPYVGGDTAMVVLLPDEGSFQTFEEGLSAEQLVEILDGLKVNQVTLSMPKFEYESSFQLSDILKEMGMVSAFESADFSGIVSQGGLSISEVVHKAFVSVDEAGTEAAAATAVVIVESAIRELVEMNVDRPFLFLILDEPTGSILFMGRVVNPAE